MSKRVQLKGKNFVLIRAGYQEDVFPETLSECVLISENSQTTLYQVLETTAGQIAIIDAAINGANGINHHLDVVDASLGKLAPNITEDSSITSVSLSTNDLKGGKTYVYGELASLSIGELPSISDEDSKYETTIYFTSGSIKTVFSLYNNTKVIGDFSIDANTEYVIVIRDGNIVIAPISTYTT